MANEKRLIDANDAVKLLRGKCVAKYPSTFLMGLLVAATEIEQSPTVDAVEVVHGRWDEWWPGISLIMTGEEMLYRCSACDAKYADVDGYKFCPNCGAKMDGAGNG